MLKLTYKIHQKAPGHWPLRQGLLLGLLAIVIALSQAVGSYHVSMADMAAWMRGELDEGHRAVLANLFFAIRLPRIVAGVVIGAALSVSGAAARRPITGDLGARGHHQRSLFYGPGVTGQIRG